MSILSGNMYFNCSAHWKIGCDVCAQRVDWFPAALSLRFQKIYDQLLLADPEKDFEIKCRDDILRLKSLFGHADIKKLKSMHFEALFLQEYFRVFDRSMNNILICNEPHLAAEKSSKDYVFSHDVDPGWSPENDEIHLRWLCWNNSFSFEILRYDIGFYKFPECYFAYICGDTISALKKLG